MENNHSKYQPGHNLEASLRSELLPAFDEQTKLQSETGAVVINFALRKAQAEEEKIARETRLRDYTDMGMLPPEQLT